MTLRFELVFPTNFCIKLETVLPSDILEIKTNLQSIDMKLSEVKAQVAAAAAQSTEAFSELGSKISDLQKQVDDLIAAAQDPDVTDETFLADLGTLKTNVAQLADIVPNTTSEPPTA